MVGLREAVHKGERVRGRRGGIGVFRVAIVVGELWWSWRERRGEVGGRSELGLVVLGVRKSRSLERAFLFLKVGKLALLELSTLRDTNCGQGSGDGELFDLSCLLIEIRYLHRFSGYTTLRSQEQPLPIHATASTER